MGELIPRVLDAAEVWTLTAPHPDTYQHNVQMVVSAFSFPALMTDVRVDTLTAFTQIHICTPYLQHERIVSFAADKVNSFLPAPLACVARM